MSANRGINDWYICSGPSYEEKPKFCVVDAWLADHRGMERCVRHGDILIAAPELHGLSRKDARKRIIQSQITKKETDR